MSKLKVAKLPCQTHLGCCYWLPIHPPLPPSLWLIFWLKPHCIHCCYRIPPSRCYHSRRFTCRIRCPCATPYRCTSRPAAPLCLTAAPFSTPLHLLYPLLHPLPCRCLATSAAPPLHGSIRHCCPCRAAPPPLPLHPPPHGPAAAAASLPRCTRRSRPHVATAAASAPTPLARCTRCCTPAAPCRCPAASVSPAAAPALPFRCTRRRCTCIASTPLHPPPHCLLHPPPCPATPAARPLHPLHSRPCPATRRSHPAPLHPPPRHPPPRPLLPCCTRFRCIRCTRAAASAAPAPLHPPPLHPPRCVAAPAPAAPLHPLLPLLHAAPYAAVPPRCIRCTRVTAPLHPPPLHSPPLRRCTPASAAPAPLRPLLPRSPQRRCPMPLSHYTCRSTAACCTRSRCTPPLRRCPAAVRGCLASIVI
ncbi:hypothetical protein B0H14DRAFT_3892227 [Mycena olivaceomarginata]|nr:hypothetical protein B0H14DRAFT_3892227 [Mycena olivaceomarginata]